MLVITAATVSNFIKSIKLLCEIFKLSEYQKREHIRHFEMEIEDY